MNLFAWLNRQTRWSNATFGRTQDVATRLRGIREHINAELVELDAEPISLEEITDVTILSFEYALRAGHSPHEIIKSLEAKQTANMARAWEPPVEGRASFHVKPFAERYGAPTRFKIGDRVYVELLGYCGTVISITDNTKVLYYVKMDGNEGRQYYLEEKNLSKPETLAPPREPRTTANAGLVKS